MENIVKFNCKPNCWDCCGVVPIPKDIVKKFEHLAQVQPIEIVEIDGEIYPLTEDCQCVFLHREIKKCMIYKDRPEVCRNYGIHPELECPYFEPDGRKRRPVDVKRTQRRINKTVSRALRDIRKKIKND